MKFIKTVAVLLAVSVSFMVPSFAWDSDSFVGQDFYFYEPVINYVAQSPSLMADSSSSSSSSLFTLSDASFSADGASFSTLIDGYWPPVDAGAIQIPGYWVTYSSPTVEIPSSSFHLDPGASTGYMIYTSGSFDIPVIDTPSDTITTFENSRITFSRSSYSFDFTFNSDVYAFSLEGLVDCILQASFAGVSKTFSFSDVDLYVNDNLVHSFYANDTLVDFGGYVYSSPAKVNSVRLIFNFSSGTFSGDYEGSTLNYLRFYTRPSTTFSLSILSDDGILSGQAGSTQDDVNEIEGIESQWGNSMTDNFNALSLDTFTYPDGLTSGFSLISGIFQDLWNAMGSYSILYVLPLTLAVVLLLIGRISKFAGQGRSSPSKEE